MPCPYLNSCYVKKVFETDKDVDHCLAGYIEKCKTAVVIPAHHRVGTLGCCNH